MKIDGEIKNRAAQESPLETAPTVTATPAATPAAAPPDAEPTSRRNLLAWLVSLMNVGVAAAIFVPAVGFMAAPIRRKAAPGAWIPVLKDEELNDGETKSVNYRIEVQDAYLTAQREYTIFLHRKGAQVVAFDSSCPHLGCHVEFRENKQHYICPCHGGVFDNEGNLVSGPPPRGLFPIKARVEQGQIQIFRV